ncbi:MAG: hypothetical protein ACRD26_24015 [Vicinamibacterales bacterium]
MRFAWFRPAVSTTPPAGRAEAAGPADDTALLLRALAARHTIDVIDERRAHDFVWQYARNPHELCVYELGGTPAHQFAAAYAVHFPGIVILRGLPRHDHALRAARLVVVPHEPVAQAIADDVPGARVRTLTPGVEPLSGDADMVINALRWPPDGGALTYAMAGLAAGRAVIVFDGPETADWPSLDPQTWEPRAPLPGREPICVSVDPRDEAHSLRLARRRLGDDPALRARLGAAATAWWREHATVRLASEGFEHLLAEARALPKGLVDADDWSSTARRVLDDFGMTPGSRGLGPLS